MPRSTPFLIILSMLILVGCGAIGTSGGSTSCSIEGSFNESDDQSVGITFKPDASTTHASVAQSFTISSDYNVKNLSVRLARHGSFAADAAYKLTVTIETDSSGKPSGTVQGAASTYKFITDITSTSAQTYQFDFPSEVALSKATTYWIRLKANYPAHENNYIRWLGFEGTMSVGYSNGQAIVESPLGTWDPTILGELRDMTFQLGC